VRTQGKTTAGAAQRRSTPWNCKPAIVGGVNVAMSHFMSRGDALGLHAAIVGGIMPQLVTGPKSADFGAVGGLLG
jgi:hypothetical protein